MNRILRVTVARCIACGKCELACAFAHGTDGSAGQPRIRVVRRGPDAGSPLVCFQCEDAACIDVCPTGALVRNVATGAIAVDSDRCVRCRVCVAACPFGHIAWDAGCRGPKKCDLCGGEPRCVPFCSAGALEYLPADKVARHDSQPSP
jgi:anaerobic carbon-monoxide dehydrogenase iron sulfur subunit